MCHFMKAECNFTPWDVYPVLLVQTYIHLPLYQCETLSWRRPRIVDSFVLSRVPLFFVMQIKMGADLTINGTDSTR